LKKKNDFKPQHLISELVDLEEMKKAKKANIFIIKVDIYFLLV
jgi:hypothetical protein